VKTCASTHLDEIFKHLNHREPGNTTMAYLFDAHVYRIIGVVGRAELHSVRMYSG